jgi:hypothetical protein
MMMELLLMSTEPNRAEGTEPSQADLIPAELSKPNRTRAKLKPRQSQSSTADQAELKEPSR